MRLVGYFRGDEIVVTIPLSVNLPFWLLLALPDWYSLDGIKANCEMALTVAPFVLAGVVLMSQLAHHLAHRRL